MPKYKGVELSDEEFNDLHRLIPSRGKNVTVPKDKYEALLRDHSILHDMAKPEPLAADKE